MTEQTTKARDTAAQNAVRRATGAVIEGDWEADGYAIIRGAVPFDQVKAWTVATDRLHARFLAGEIPNLSQDKETATVYPPHWEWIDDSWCREEIAFRRWRIVEDDPVFLETLDHPGWFEFIRELFGSALQVSLTHAVVYPPEAKDAPYLHIDGGDALGRIPTPSAGPPLAVKAMIFLTDLLEEDCGNFTVVPGSHRRPYDAAEAQALLSSGNARQLRVAAGDVVLFPHSLWHGPSRNLSSQARKTLFVGYSPTFLRPYDYEAIESATLDAATPRQRRLLGNLDGWGWRAGCHFYSGPDQDAIMAGPHQN